MPLRTGNVRYKTINFEKIVIVFAIAISPLSIKMSEIKSVIIAIPTIFINSEICDESILKLLNTDENEFINSSTYSSAKYIIAVIAKMRNKNTYSGL